MRERRDFLADERQVARKTQQANAAEVSLCEQALNYVLDGFNRLERPFRWNDRSGTILKMATLGGNSLRWAFELLLKGYYSQANALSRLAWECWMHGAYLHLYQERPVKDWSEFDTRPAPAEMRKLVAERAAEVSTVDADELRDGMATLYHGYSGYSHPSEEALRVLVTKREGEFWLRLGPGYDDLLVRESSHFLSTAAVMLSTLFELVGLEDMDYKAKGGELRQAAADWRRERTTAHYDNEPEAS